ncbi:glycosyltransferase family 2 protein [Rhodococcus sp. IEGM 1381]|uniref:glycosyltransferase family 2 protein n=1 Tax=Rhodococcus sp. IEGM 1381 TaxID=3047085 RepID=UPI0024B748C0|nr:glycosyltransferase family 2 protein [Rhodococcus sp. IEGM 1381]MDI9894236.1 glycosyltransferase family 2 protein [Rhodococcus sp. IEGM 1381]
MTEGNRLPVVSVITISYRDAPGLRATIDSVRAQKYPHIEHIVIDGGSGDLVERYLQSQGHLRYWQSEQDGGRYDAMNQGAGQSSGDILWWLHSGDSFADSGTVATVAIELSKNGTRSTADRWGYGKVVRRLDGASLGEWGYMPFDRVGFALGIRPIPHQAAFIGRDVVTALGGYDTTFGLAADQLFMLRAALFAEPDVVPVVLTDFDASGVGSVRPQKEHFADVRRSWDLIGYYPYGGRARSRVMSAWVEWTARTKATIRHISGLVRVELPRRRSDR